MATAHCSDPGRKESLLKQTDVLKKKKDYIREKWEFNVTGIVDAEKAGIIV